MSPFFAGIIFGMAFIVGIALIIPESTVPYKQGQIDALSGKIIYHLVEKPDGTKVWERK